MFLWAKPKLKMIIDIKSSLRNPDINGMESSIG